MRYFQSAFVAVAYTELWWCAQVEPAVQPSVRTLDWSLINTVNSMSALSLAQA